jgi:hypothetical protein
MLSQLRSRTAIVTVICALLVVLALTSLFWSSRQPSVPPLEYRQDLVAALEKERAVETMDKLGDFDDVGWVSGSFPQLVPPKRSLGHNILLIPRLNRVRKLLEMGRAQPDMLVPLLEERFEKSSLGFKQAEAAFWKEHPDGGTWKPTEYHRKAIESPATAYLLCELRAFRSLPVMLKVFLSPEKELSLNRVYLWYIMHLLVIEHPREGLSKDALAVLDAYKAETSLVVPLPTSVRVTAWNAPLEESDPRLKLSGQGVPKNQPTMEVREYPHTLGTDFHDRMTWDLNAKGKELFQKMKKFIDLAYPQAK